MRARFILGVSAALGGGAWLFRGDAFRPHAGPHTTTLPVVWTADEVRAYTGDRVLVTYKDGVYDVTEFVSRHPGSASMLLQAQGGPVDEHWEYWARHLASPTAAAELARLRVGRLSDPVAPADPYAEGQPERALQLHHVIQERPLCTETLCNVLDADAVTPNEAFYIRNHAPVPRLPLDGAHRLALGPTRTVSVQELQDALPVHEVLSVLQCTGNRGGDDETHQTTTNTFYWNVGPGMIGNAQWRGVRIADALRHFGLVDEGVALKDSTKHLVLHGADGYSVSVPLAAVHGDCLLATHMNGVPLPGDHGAPVRAVLPGLTGARSVKWLVAVSVEDRECDSPWQRHYYLRDCSPIIEMPIQSIILGGTLVQSDKLHVRGIAWAGASGLPVQSVQVRCGDSGTWHECELEPTSQNKPTWGWTRWSVMLGDRACREDTVVVRATDGVQQQPTQRHPEPSYLNNTYHRWRFASKT